MGLTFRSKSAIIGYRSEKISGKRARLDEKRTESESKRVKSPFSLFLEYLGCFLGEHLL